MQQINEIKPNIYNGFYHYHTLDKKNNRMIFIGSKKSDEVDSFEENLSVNPFLDYYKSKSNYSEARSGKLLGMTRIVIDIDAHNTTSKNQKIIISTLTQSLLNDNHDVDFSEIITTGRGIQVHINIEQTSYVLDWLYEKASRHQTERFIKAIQDIKYTYEIKEDIEVDITASISPRTLIRVSNTYNSINQVKAQSVYKNNRLYELNDLLKEVEVKKESLTSKFTCETFEKNLITSRLNYLLSNDHKVEVGNRMKTLFLLYNNLVQLEDKETARYEVYRFNRSLKQKLKSSEIESMITYIDKKGFLKFRKSTFIDWTGAKNIETKRDKEAINKQKKSLRNKTIKAMLSDESITYEQISKQVSVSLITVKRHAKKLGITRNRPSKA